MEGARRVAELREMARGPMAIFERFMGELQRITGDKAIQAPLGVERLKELQAATVREIEESLQRFRGKVGEAEAALGGLLRPPRPSLDEEIQRLERQLGRLRGLAARRDALLGRWGGEPAEAVLQDYRAALESRDVELAELYEAEAEEVLRRSGEAAALQAFQALRAQAEEGRLSASQKQARARLEEIERLKNEVTLATRILASTLRVSGSLAVAGAGGRKGSRVRLDPEAQARTPILIHRGPHPALSASLVDASLTGLRVAIPEDLPAGSALDVIVKPGDDRQNEVRMQGEVRWSKPDARSLGRFLAGVRLGTRPGDEWATLVSRLAEAQHEG